MTITTLQQALDNVPSADAAPSYDSQLQLALAYWQSIQTTPAAADLGANYDTAADEDGGSDATSDASVAISLIQAEIARIGG